MRQAMGRSVIESSAVSCTVEKTSPVDLKMPLEQAAQFAGFLVNTAIGFAHVASENPMVGGPIRIATITRAEGFRMLVPVSPWPPSLVDLGQADNDQSR
jgi:hypothetical protein